MKKPKILVAGSFVMDLIVSTEIFPGSGETVLGKNFRTATGGKGANQAVQMAKLGASVTMIGRVGDDVFGKELTSAVKKVGINTSYIKVDREKPSAIGNVLLEVAEGQKTRNRIIVVPGANMAIKPADVTFLEDKICEYDMVVLQHEIPMEINEIVARYARDRSVPVMLNPAPAAPLSDKMLSYLTYIAPNEHEATQLTGVAIRKDNDRVNLDDVKAAADVLRKKGVENVIITLGSGGAAIVDKDGLKYSPCVDIVEVKDPTAAGDSFIGAFTVGICVGLNHKQALDFANYTATITVSRIGAQPSLPVLNDVIRLMKQDNFTAFDFSRFEVLKGSGEGVTDAE